MCLACHYCTHVTASIKTLHYLTAGNFFKKILIKVFPVQDFVCYQQVLNSRFSTHKHVPPPLPPYAILPQNPLAILIHEHRCCFIHSQQTCQLCVCICVCMDVFFFFFLGGGAERQYNTKLLITPF